jgi:hypothetical protein
MSTRQPPGKAVEWSEADLTRLAMVTPEDVLLARAMVAARLPTRLARLWSATARRTPAAPVAAPPEE